jgi:putative heme iron utilization protein
LTKALQIYNSLELAAVLKCEVRDLKKKIMLALPEEMLKVLEKERKDRYLETIPETVRVILSEYLRKG